MLGSVFSRYWACEGTQLLYTHFSPHPLRLCSRKHSCCRTEHRGGHTWSNLRDPSGPLSSKAQSTRVGELQERKPLARSLRPLLSAPGVEPSSHYLTRHLGRIHGSEVLGLEPESVAASPLGSHTYPCEKESWFSSCVRAHENIWCIILPLNSSLHRLNTPVPLNNNPAIWFADTALAWMCFLASGTSEEIDVLRIKSTHYSFFFFYHFPIADPSSLYNK